MPKEMKTKKLSMSNYRKCLTSKQSKLLGVKKHIVEDERRIPTRPFVLPSFFHCAFLDYVQYIIEYQQLNFTQNSQKFLVYNDKQISLKTVWSNLPKYCLHGTLTPLRFPRSHRRDLLKRSCLNT